MSNNKKLVIPRVSNQGGLFDGEIVEGALDVSLSFRAELSKALSRSKESRWQQAAKISELSRHSITPDMLNKLTSSNLDYALRAEDLPAVIMVTGHLGLARVLLNPIGCDAIDPTESKLIKLARLQQDSERIQAEITKLKQEISK